MSAWAIIRPDAGEFAAVGAGLEVCGSVRADINYSAPRAHYTAVLASKITSLLAVARARSWCIDPKVSLRSLTRAPKRRATSPDRGRGIRSSPRGEMREDGLGGGFAGVHTIRDTDAVQVGAGQGKSSELGGLLFDGGDVLQMTDGILRHRARPAP